MGSRVSGCLRSLPCERGREDREEKREDGLTAWRAWGCRVQGGCSVLPARFRRDHHGEREDRRISSRSSRQKGIEALKWHPPGNQQVPTPAESRAPPFSAPPPGPARPTLGHLDPGPPPSRDHLGRATSAARLGEGESRGHPGRRTTLHRAIHPPQEARPAHHEAGRRPPASGAGARGQPTRHEAPPAGAGGLSTTCMGDRGTNRARARDVRDVRDRVRRPNLRRRKGMGLPEAGNGLTWATSP